MQVRVYSGHADEGLAAIDTLSAPTTRGTRHVVAASLTVATAGILPIQLTGALAVQLRADIALEPSSLGLATTSFFLASVAMSLAFGHRIDQFGWRRAMAIATGGQAMAMLGICLFADSVAMLIGLLALAGLAHAVGMPAGNLAIVEHVPAQRRAAVFGIRQSAIPTATLFAGLAVPAIGLTVGWRWAFAVSLLGPLATFAFLRAGWSAANDRAEAGGGGRGRILSPGLVAIIGTTVLGAGIVNVSGAFFVSSAVASGTSESLAGTLLAIGSISAIASRILVGISVDRQGGRGFGPMTGMLLAGSVGWALLATGKPIALVVGTPLAFGAGTGWAGLLHHILVAQHPDNPAGASAMVLAFGYAGGAVAPLAFGFAAGEYGYAPAWWATVACALGAATLTNVAERRFPVVARVPATSGGSA